MPNDFLIGDSVQLWSWTEVAIKLDPSKGGLVLAFQTFCCEEHEIEGENHIDTNWTIQNYFLLNLYLFLILQLPKKFYLEIIGKYIQVSKIKFFISSVKNLCFHKFAQIIMLCIKPVNGAVLSANNSWPWKWDWTTQSATYVNPLNMKYLLRLPKAINSE